MSGIGNINLSTIAPTMNVAVPGYADAGPSTGEVMEPALRLGGITFRNNEHPQELPFKNTEMMAVHELPGGGRVIQTLGIQPQPITFTGILWDTNAKPRLDALRAIQSAGNPVDLIWGDERYSVIVKELEAVYHNQWRIHYTITLEVLADESGKYTRPIVTSVDNQAQGLFTQSQLATQNLQILDTTSTVNAFVPNLNALGTWMNILGPIAQASGTNITSTLSAAATIIGQVTAYQTGLQTTLNNSNGTMSVSTQQQLFWASQLVSNLQSIVGLINSGQSPRLVNISGPISLYEVASQFYKDHTRATQIQAMNNITGMNIPAGVTLALKLPPDNSANASSTGT